MILSREEVGKKALKDSQYSCMNSLLHSWLGFAAAIVHTYLSETSYEDTGQSRPSVRIAIKKRLQNSFVSADLIASRDKGRKTNVN